MEGSGMANKTAKDGVLTKDSVVDGMNAKELAAIISAAIAAANGDGKVNFRIRSIKQL